MINLSNHGYLFIHEGFLYEALSSQTKIDEGQRRWDLTQIASILTVSSIEDAEARNAAIRDARRRRMIKGALAGGMLDAAMGDGDSIVDGVLLGAAFTYISSKGTETPTACIGIVFLDGEYLSLRVEAHDYAQLQAAAAAAQLKRDEAAETKPSLSCLPLSRKTCDRVLSARANDEAKGRAIPLIGVGCGGVMLAIMVLGLAPWMLEGTPDIIQEIAKFAIYLWGSVGVAITVWGFFRAFIPRSIESFLRNDAEKATYSIHPA